MKTRSLLISPPLRWLAVFAALTILVPIARPQSRPVATPPGADAKRTPQPLEETLVLNPFEVIATSDKSYGALNSNSITAFNTELFKLPISADIFDETFMKDTGMTSAEDMVQNFSAGAGITGPDPSLNAGLNQPGDRNRVAFIQLRGLTTGTPKRDSLLPVGNVNQPGSTAIGFTSTFDIERVEVINGPQALLYGSGGAGGVLNYVSKQARIGKPAFGSVQVQVDNFGGVLGLADFGASTRNVAIRVAVLKQELKTRRDLLGGPVDGLYVQGALRLGNHTTLRLIAEQTTYDKTKSIQYTLNSTSTAVDARHGARFDYLMATNQIMQSSSGASGAGAILNGAMNWDNLNSLGGSWAKDKTVSTLTSVSADTRWNKWLSTKLSAGYYDYHNDYYANTVTIYAPNVAANPLPGHWTYAQTGADPAHDSFQTNRDKAFRFLALANNQLFGGRVHSQTAFGADFTRVVLSNINYGLYLADDNWNPVVNPAIATRDGRTAVAPIFWAIDNGPVKDGPFAPNANQVIWQGKKYLRMVQNPAVDSRIVPGNPMGTRLGGETTEQGKVIERGVFGTNYAQWYDSRFDTMVGFRLQDSYYEYFNSGTAPGNISLSKGTTFNFNVGADYRLTHSLRPYFAAASSFLKPPNMFVDPYGNAPELQHAVGGEVGLKFQNAPRTVSATLAAYFADSKNEQQELGGGLGPIINPAGLNGSFRGRQGVHYTAHRKSNGVQLTLMASPMTNWRLRLSGAWADGRVKNAASFVQLYNDQFYANSQGQVTYRNGTVVYVPAVFSASSLTVASTVPGATPLTIAMLSNPASTYYANPAPLTAAIASGSNVVRILRLSDPVAGPILTGVTGLPITQMQIDPAPSGLAATIPGTVVINQANDVTSGYPEFSANLTSTYTIREGWFKGLDLGGSIIAGWRNRGFYYYPNNYTTATLGARTLFFLPTRLSVNPMIGYTHRFRRHTWTARLNIANVLNHYNVVLLPHAVTGWTSRNVIGTTFDQQPRSYQLSNTIGF